MKNYEPGVKISLTKHGIKDKKDLMNKLKEQISNKHSIMPQPKYFNERVY